ncbi:MAG TPA: 1,4-alpha-glucan branching protein GlgB [Longimicrobiales bacterium]
MLRQDERGRADPGARTTGPAPVRHDVTLLTEDDVYLFNEGSHLHLYRRLGAHPLTVEGVAGTYFAVWAPNAEEVAVMGEFNRWNRSSHMLRPRGSSGIWEGFIPGVGQGDLYKYHIKSWYYGYRAEKADPVGFRHEEPPRTASIVWDLAYTWGDDAWMRERDRRNAGDAAISIYEVHLGSWMRVPQNGHRPLTYRELAPRLAEYVLEMGFTHVELLPVMEHPFYGSWGYQVTGYFAPTGRYGSPQDFMYFIDYLHQRGIGVILDWVPSHFPTDAHGLAFFDGTHLYEHADPRKGFHPDWNSLIFNYGRNEVRSFLFSSAMFWLDVYHADGLRVDAVASMLYLDYSREPGEWVPNVYGGRENLEAIAFLRRMNEEIYRAHPDVQTIAEESTAWPMVSRPTYVGGLGFGMKWDMGWMHDTLRYTSRDPIHRKYHHNDLTFRLLYAFHENFVLPLSHDEVVHGKGALLRKIPGDEWQQFATLRALYGHMWAHPGKQLLFMGGELGQGTEWSEAGSLDWYVLDYPLHEGIRRCVADLNRAYRAEPALWEVDFRPEGFSWLVGDAREDNVLAYARFSGDGARALACLVNFSPVVRHHWRVPLPLGGAWREVMNTDAEFYGGSGIGNLGGVEAVEEPLHGRAYSATMTLPPLATVWLVPAG